MTLTLQLPGELERELAAEAERLGLPLEEYALRLLATRHTALPGEESPRTGAEVVAFWREHGVIGARPEIEDSGTHARELRRVAEHRRRY